MLVQKRPITKYPKLVYQDTTLSVEKLREVIKELWESRKKGKRPITLYFQSREARDKFNSILQDKFREEAEKYLDISKTLPTFDKR